MGLKHLSIEPEPFMEAPVIHVPTKTQDENDFEAMTPLEGEGNQAYKDEHGEDPIHQFWEMKTLNDEETEVAMKLQKVAEMQAIKDSIAMEGLIDQDTARNIEKYIPDFYYDAGGGRRFTYTPSLEGVTYALEALDSGVLTALRDAFMKAAEWATSLYNKLAAVVNKFVERMKNASQAGNTDNLVGELNEKNEKAFVSAEKPMQFLDTIVSDADKAIALLTAELRNDEGTADQDASIDRANEVFKQQMEAAAAAVEAFKKSVSQSAYGRKMMGQTDDASTPSLEDIQRAAEGVKKLGDALAALNNMQDADDLVNGIEAIKPLVAEYKEVLADDSNKGEGSEMDLSKHTLVDIYNQAKQFMQGDKNNVDLASLKSIIATTQEVSKTVQTMASSMKTLGDRILALDGTSEKTVVYAKAAIQDAVSVSGRLVQSVLTAAKVMSGSTEGKVWVTSSFAKLSNMAASVIKRGTGPLSEESTRKVYENAKRHYGLDLGVKTDAPPEAGAGADTSAGF